MLDRVRDLAREVESLAAGLRTEVTGYPSGAFSLDVFWQNRGWNMTYSPEWGFGVDDVERDGFDYSFVTKDFAAAAQRLIEVVTESVGTHRRGSSRSAPES